MSQNEPEQNIQKSQINPQKRKLTIGNESSYKFNKKQSQEEEEEVVTEIGFDVGNSQLDESKVPKKNQLKIAKSQIQKAEENSDGS